jgi:anti-sigma factor RsiW
MGRLSTIMATASAAALSALAVTIAVPAIADDGGGTDPFASCLRTHGLSGAPDGAALKPWLGERLARTSTQAKQALKACAPEPGIVRPGPSEQELRSCLADHGIDVPAGDARALKRWLQGHADDAASSDAMKACDMAPPTKLGVSCAPAGSPGPGAPGTEPASVAGRH